MLAAAGISDALTAGAAAVKERDELNTFLGAVGDSYVRILCSVCAKALESSIFFAWINRDQPVYCSGECCRAAEMWPDRKVDPNRWWPGYLVEKRARLLGNKYGGGDYWMGDLTDGQGRLKL